MRLNNTNSILLVVLFYSCINYLYQLVRHQYPSTEKRLLDDVLGMNFSINIYAQLYPAIPFCECSYDFRFDDEQRCLSSIIPSMVMQSFFQSFHVLLMARWCTARKLIRLPLSYL